MPDGPHALPASLWAATAIPAPPYAEAKSDTVADVAIVGAGYTGLSTALHLSQAGKKVIVVEASEPGWGASGRNGGQIIAGLKHDPDKLEAKWPAEKTLRNRCNVSPEKRDALAARLAAKVKALRKPVRETVKA